LGASPVAKMVRTSASAAQRANIDSHRATFTGPRRLDPPLVPYRRLRLATARPCGHLIGTGEAGLDLFERLSLGFRQQKRRSKEVQQRAAAAVEE
jgi:hypothetical protein